MCIGLCYKTCSLNFAWKLLHLTRSVQRNRTEKVEMKNNNKSCVLLYLQQIQRLWCQHCFKQYLCSSYCKEVASRLKSKVISVSLVCRKCTWTVEKKEKEQKIGPYHTIIYIANKANLCRHLQLISQEIIFLRFKRTAFRSNAEEFVVAFFFHSHFHNFSSISQPFRNECMMYGSRFFPLSNIFLSNSRV